MSDQQPIEVDTDTDDWKEEGDQALSPTDHIRPVSGLMAAPGLSHIESIRSNLWAMGEGDASDIAGSCVGIAGTLADFAAKIGAFGSPFSALQTVVSMGFDIVLALVKPLEDLLHMVSGDPGAMRDRIDLWGRIGEALKQLSQDTAAVVPDIANWSTMDGNTAKTKLDELAAGISAMGHNTGGIEQLMGLAQMMAELIKEAIKWVISWLIAKLIESAIAGSAGAVVTFGSSVAAAICKMVGDAARAVLKALGFTKDAMRIANGFAKVCVAISGSQALTRTQGILLTMAGSASTALGNAGQAFVGNLFHSPADGQSTDSTVSAGIVIADIQAISDAESRLRPLATGAGNIAEAAGTAVDGEMTWGLCGILFEEKYKETAGEMIAKIKLSQDALNGSAEKLKRSAEDWESIDQEIKDAFDGLRPE
ncbi:hypothetical protein [Glycomyces tenuis]|uniref:hypothetical protein n=1 Tax=Glycomyces tenuis TaxID=58116 RepID=UPI000416D23B|nr:hypothetical protein [Glycomyces tenuis]